MVEIDLSHVDIQKHGGYTEYNFEKAKDLYNVLLNFNDTLNKKSKPYYPVAEGQYRWMFRGHWNSNWGIISSAFREGWHYKFLSQPFDATKIPTGASGPQIVDLKDLEIVDMVKMPIMDRFRYHITAEFMLLARFMGAANSLGIECNYTPSFYEYMVKIRNSYDKDSVEELKKWPHNEVLPLMTLAQHHGLPTRLLDFTYNSLFAAFFAAFYPFKFKDTPVDSKLCVWAFNEESIMTNGLQKIPTPINRSGNIFSQEGVLIADNKANELFMKNGKWRYLIPQKNDKPFVKLTLPQSQYKDLLRLLWEHNITPERIMPNLDSVSQTLEYKQWLWIKNN